MANVTRERTGTLLRALFQILKDHPDGLRARDALEQLRHAVTMTEYESGTYAAGALRFDKIVRFATIDCVKAVNGGEKSWRVAGEKCSALPEEMTRWSVAGSSLRGVYSLIRLYACPA